MDRLRVVTLNIWNRSGEWDQRRALIRAGLDDLAPDVVGLQEVIELRHRGVARDLAAEIAEGSELEARFSKAHDLAPGLSMGNAILTRHPVLEHDTLPLPGLEQTGEARSLLFARIDTPAGVLPVFVTHLSWKLHEGWVRVLQVEAIAEHVRRRCPIDSGDLPPVVMGDLNAEPESDEIRYLKGLHPLGGRSVYFADTWAWAGDGGPGYTFDPKNPYAAQAVEPPRRIDYVLVRGPDRRGRGRPVECRIVFDRPRGEIWPTDHFGVMTDLAVG